MNRVLSTLALAFGVVAPAPAAAVDRDLGSPSRARIAVGPALAGDTVVWGARRGLAHVVLRAPIRGGRTRELARLVPRSPAEDTAFHSLAASAVGYTFGFVRDQGRAGREVIFEAGLFGATRRGFGCSGDDSDIDGTRVVGGCAELVDLATDAPPRRLTEASVARLRIAGNFVAWVETPSVSDERNHVVVYDLAAEQIAYRVDPGGRVGDLDVQDDGTVVFALDRDGSTRVATSSPDAPTPRTLPLPARQFYAVRLAGDRIAYVGGRFEARRFKLGVMGLDGRRFGERAKYRGGFDFDGRRLAWFARRDRRVLLRVRRV